MTQRFSPRQAYDDAVAHLDFAADAAQAHAADVLDACYRALHDDSARPSGVYLWGPVGRGKTWLMDRFHASLAVPARRQHFHHFMRWVHRRQFQLSGTPDPLTVMARELREEVQVLCLDELFVSDIADAMLLGRLMQALFDAGVVLVTTSNQPPNQLYAEGYNRERLERSPFELFIGFLARHSCQQACLPSSLRFRRNRLDFDRTPLKSGPLCLQCGEQSLAKLGRRGRNLDAGRLHRGDLVFRATLAA